MRNVKTELQTKIDECNRMEQALSSYRDDAERLKKQYVDSQNQSSEINRMVNELMPFLPTRDDETLSPLQILQQTISLIKSIISERDSLSITVNEKNAQLGDLEEAIAESCILDEEIMLMIKNAIDVSFANDDLKHKLSQIIKGE